jgi:hypothetical protein
MTDVTAPLDTLETPTTIDTSVSVAASSPEPVPESFIEAITPEPQESTEDAETVKTLTSMPAEVIFHLDRSEDKGTGQFCCDFEFCLTLLNIISCPQSWKLRRILQRVP